MADPARPMPVPALAARAPAASDGAALPDPGLLHLLTPKLLTARARAKGQERGRGARFAVLATLTLLFWGGAFAGLYRILSYFKAQPEIGPFLAGKILGVLLLSFFSILLL